MVTLIHEQIATFEEKKYQLAETIMGRHMPPRIQINEFDMQPDKIRCNEGLILIQKHDGSPACVTLETKTKLFERGWIHYDESLSIKFAPLLLGHPKYTFDWCTTNNGVWVDVRDTCYLQSQKDLDQSSVDLQAYTKLTMESKENED